MRDGIRNATITIEHIFGFIGAVWVVIQIWDFLKNRRNNPGVGA